MNWLAGQGLCNCGSSFVGAAGSGKEFLTFVFVVSLYLDCVCGQTPSPMREADRFETGIASACNTVFTGL